MIETMTHNEFILACYIAGLVVIAVANGFAIVVLFNRQNAIAKALDITLDVVGETVTQIELLTVLTGGSLSVLSNDETVIETMRRLYPQEFSEGISDEEADEIDREIGRQYFEAENPDSY